MRSSTEAKQVVARAGRYAEVYPPSDDRKDPSALKVKEVWVEDQRRYIVCLNEDQATKDRHDRDAVVASLREALKHGDKLLAVIRKRLFFGHRPGALLLPGRAWGGCSRVWFRAAAGIGYSHV